MEELNGLRERAESPNALHGCTSNPCGSVVCQTARDRDELLSRLEQAEQDRDNMRNRLDAMRRQRDGYRNQLRKTEQQLQTMRAALEAIQELHKPVAFYGEDADWWVCGHCHDNHPCATRRLADQGLGDNLARTTKNGENNE